MLDKCPRCGYVLTGLPEDHACPECGLRYDGGSRIYRQPPTSLFANVAGLGAGLYGLFILLRLYRDLPGIWRGLVLLLLSFYCLGMSWAAYCVYRLQSRGRYMATSLDGLLVALVGFKVELVPWSNISRVEQARAALGIVLFIRDKRVAKNIAGVFKSPKEVEEFVHYASMRIGGGEGTGATTISNLQKGAGDALIKSQAVIGTLPLRSARENKNTLLPVASFVLFLAAILCLQLAWRPLGLVLIALSVAVALWSAVWVLLGRKIPKSIELTAGGLRMVHGGEEIFACNWSDFDRAIWSRWSPQLRIETVSRTPILQLLVLEVGSQRRVREYVDTINRVKAEQEARLAPAQVISPPA